MFNKALINLIITINYHFYFLKINLDSLLQPDLVENFIYDLKAILIPSYIKEAAALRNS